MLAHSSALAPVWLSSLPPFALGALTCLVLMHGAWTIRRSGLLMDRGAVIEFTLDAQGNCALALRDGRTLLGRVYGTTLVTGRLAVLVVRASGCKPFRHVTIAADAVDAVLFRQLRIHLKWTRTQLPASQA